MTSSAGWIGPGIMSFRGGLCILLASRWSDAGWRPPDLDRWTPTSLPALHIQNDAGVQVRDHALEPLHKVLTLRLAGRHRRPAVKIGEVIHSGEQPGRAVAQAVLPRVDPDLEAARPPIGEAFVT